MSEARLTTEFFNRDVLQVAPCMLGKTLVRVYPDGTVGRFCITETEAYRGIEDLACHASKGLTPRTQAMFGPAGFLYVYLIYGIYWMLNIVADTENNASAVLIRGINEVIGPGRVGRLLQIDKSFYGESLALSNRIWIEGDASEIVNHSTHKRVGIDYAGEPWVSKPWRFRSEYENLNYKTARN